jgi:FKBP-type peptidyl-prolyl cis-trans isomerase
MKKLLSFLFLSMVLAGILGSCKDDPLDALRENELVALDKYVKDNNLTNNKDASGIYFKDLVVGTGDTIKAGYKLKLYFDITFLDGTAIPAYGFSTQDEFGRNYEEVTFYVDATSSADQYIQQISGIHIGLKKMRVGGKAFMVIPSELAFKAVDNSSTTGIPRFSTLLATVTVKDGLSPKQQQEN